MCGHLQDSIAASQDMGLNAKAERNFSGIYLYVVSFQQYQHSKLKPASRTLCLAGVETLDRTPIREAPENHLRHHGPDTNRACRLNLFLSNGQGTGLSRVVCLIFYLLLIYVFSCFQAVLNRLTKYFSGLIALLVAVMPAGRSGLRRVPVQ